MAGTTEETGSQVIRQIITIQVSRSPRHIHGRLRVRDRFSDRGTDGYMAYTEIGGIMAHMNDASAKFLSVEEAAEFLRIYPRTIYGFVSQRQIPYRKAGRRVLFLESELVEWTKPSLRRDQYLPLTG